MIVVNLLLHLVLVKHMVKFSPVVVNPGENPHRKCLSYCDEVNVLILGR